MEHKYNIDPATAKAVYDFIKDHLEVVNDEPLVEQFMMDLEEQFDLV